MSQKVEITVERDSDGFLVDPDDWSEDIARQLAARWGLELTKDHFDVIHFMRDWYAERHIVPDVRDVTPYLMEQHNLTKKEAKEFLFKLFPHGYMQQGCQVAGFRRPRAWSVG